MTESAQKILDLLQERRMLPDLTIESLRKQVAAAPQPLEAHHIAKLLQQKGKITAYQARELLAVAERGAPATANPAPSTPAAAPHKGDDELGLAVVEEDLQTTVRREAATRTKTPPAAKTTKPQAATPSAAPRTAAPSSAPPAVAPSLASNLDDLFSDPLLAQHTGPSSDPLGIAQPKRTGGWFGGLFGGPKAKRRPKASGWESPLLIVGGGALLLLIIVGSTLAWVLLRSSGDELLQAAELDYSGGAYVQAIGKYEKFLRGRADHPQASRVRVQVALAKLRLASASSDPQGALAVASELLPTIAGEPAFADARSELASLLPSIAEKFADAAAKAADTVAAAREVEQYRAAMQLVDNPQYLPTSVKAPLAAQLERMQAKIDTALREIEQADRLQTAIAAIRAASEKRDFTGAYQVQRELLQLYPRLVNNDELRAAIVSISAQLASEVHAVKTQLAPVTEDHPSSVVADLTLAKPSGQRIAALAGQVVPLVTGGVLYVLAADDGRLLWRRFVGREVESARLVGDNAAADVLVADAQRHELLCLAGGDGKLRWRLPLGEPFLLGPTIQETLLLTLPSGKLLSLDLASGQTEKQIAFPQRLAAPVAASPNGNVLFQCGDHSNLYVLDRESLACRAVHYLGHNFGTIDAPPQFIGPLLVVPQQMGLQRSLLHALAWMPDDATLRPVQQPLAIDAVLAGPLLVDGNRAAVISRSGAMRIVEAGENGSNVALTIVAEKSGAANNTTLFAAIAGGLLIVADERLAGYRVRTARGTLPAAWASHDRDQFIAPLYVSGDYVFHARRPVGKPGMLISAAALAPEKPQDAGQPIWQTHFPGEPQGAAGTPWGGGLLVPNQRGQIEFVRPEALPEAPPRAAKFFPFQPLLRPGEQVRWLAPAVIDDERFVAAEQAGRVFVVAKSTAGAPHLATASEVQIAGPLVAGPVVCGQHALFVQSRETIDVLVPLLLAGKEAGEALELTGRVVWGPLAAGDLTLLAIDPGGLVAVRSPAERAWSCDIGGETPVGAPLAVAEGIWITTSSGRAQLLALDTGEVRQTIDFGQTLASGPTLAGQRLSALAVDGLVLATELP